MPVDATDADRALFARAFDACVIGTARRHHPRAPAGGAGVPDGGRRDRPRATVPGALRGRGRRRLRHPDLHHRATGAPSRLSPGRRAEGLRHERLHAPAALLEVSAGAAARGPLRLHPYQQMRRHQRRGGARHPEDARHRARPPAEDRFPALGAGVHLRYRAPSLRQGGFTLPVPDPHQPDGTRHEPDKAERLGEAHLPGEGSHTTISP